MREGDYCYYSPSTKLSWLDARVFCQGLGGDLVTIKNYAESAFLVSKVHPYYLIGASDKANEGMSIALY